MSRKKENFPGTGKMDIWERLGRVLFGILLFGVLGVFCVIHGERAAASSASITVQAKENKLVKGDTVYILVTVSSMDEIYGFEGYFSYDNRYLKFVSGGKLVHGNDDAFHIQDLERSTGTNRILYSIKFKARKTGSTSVGLRKPYHVLGKDAVKMSVSYDEINMVIVDKETKSVTAAPAAPAEVSESPERTPDVKEEPEQLSPPPEGPQLQHEKGDEIGSVDLKNLTIAGAQLAPDFSPEIRKYSGTLTTSETMADIDYEPADSLAEVTIKGNNALQNGKNVIRLVVKNGNRKKTYRISLNVRLSKALDKSSANKVTAEKAKKKVYLSGDITIEAGAATEEAELPDDFSEVNVVIGGEEVTGYAYHGDTEQGYYLIYGKNTQSFYVYDKEKEQLLPYEQVKNWYRSMGGQDLSALEESEKTIESYQYVLGIMGAFSGLMFILMLFFALHRKG